jgi:MoaA/NifB/PqqE/SkfB family radical SAM enzyme
MEWELFQQLALEAENLQPEVVNLYAHGESFLHPRIVDMVSELHSRGLFTEIVTNGELLTVGLSQRLADAGLDKLIISHPAISPENWQECRDESYTPQVDDRIAEAVTLWGERGKEVALRCLIFKENVPEKIQSVRAYLRRWLAQPAVSEIEFWLYQPWPDHVLEEHIPYMYEKPQVCWLALDSLHVSWNGTISPCPYDTNGELAQGRFPDASLAEAYSSSGMCFFRKQTVRRSKKRPLYCRNCLINRVPASFSVINTREYHTISADKKEEWLKETGRDCWLQLIQKVPGHNKRKNKKL